MKNKIPLNKKAELTCISCTQQRIKELNEQLTECKSGLSWISDYLRERVYAIECELEAIQDGN